MTAPQHMRIGIIGGTGLGQALGAEQGEAREVDTPFGQPSSPIILTEWEGVPIALLQRHGPGHIHNPSQVPYRANIYALKTLGVTHIVASGATGSLREEMGPGELAVIDQVIDKTHKRPSTFFEGSATHIEFSEPFCPVMRRWLLEAAEAVHDVNVHKGGTYVCMEGPAFSTRAESLMHRQWGGDLIGMTVMPEARLAREAEIAYAMVAMPTDYDCWRPKQPGETEQALIEEIAGNLKHASEANLKLMRQALRHADGLRQQESPAHSALRLAIWSDKSRIDPAEVERLRPIWGHYFED